MHSEYSTLVEYLETIADLPWNRSSDASISLAAAEAQLAEDHFGMTKVKVRVTLTLTLPPARPAERRRGAREVPRARDEDPAHPQLPLRRRAAAMPLRVAPLRTARTYESEHVASLTPPRLRDPVGGA